MSQVFLVYRMTDWIAPVWTALTGSSGAECGKVGTFTVNVLNNQVWQPVTNGLWTGPDGKTYGSGSTGGGSSGTVTTAATTSTAPVTAPSVSTSQTESVCQAGTNQCSGAAVQICDYVSNANGGVLGRLLTTIHVVKEMTVRLEDHGYLHYFLRYERDRCPLLMRALIAYRRIT